MTEESNDGPIREFHCLVEGNKNVFIVEIAANKRVSYLKKIIHKEGENRVFSNIDAPELDLLKVDIDLGGQTEDSLSQLAIEVDDGNRMLAWMSVSELWQEQPSLARLQIFVKLPPTTSTIRQKRVLSESYSIFSRLKRAKIVTAAPSFTAKADVFETLQQDPSEKIFDDRPKPDPDIPSVALLYEGFGHFLDIMDGRDDVPGLADINIKKLYSEVDTFASKMNEYYKDENDRRDAALPCLTRIFSARRGIQIPELHIGSVRTDGDNIATHGAGTIVVGFKNKIAGIDAIPQVELACYVAHLNSTKVDEQLYLRWRIPCLGLAIVGCVLTFYAIITIDHRFKLVSLTPGFSCIRWARPQDVEKFRNNLLSQEIPLKARRFPVVTNLRKYPSPSDDHLNFEIRDFFSDRQPYRLLYFAATPDDQLVLIKFVRRYSIELHHFCAESGHAPRTLAFERLPGGWYAVAMEFIKDALPIAASPQLSIHRDRWTKELQRLMENFHLEGFVHGDLRDANILCKEKSVMLLDFDWGGKDGEAFYPTANLNNELEEGRVSDNLRITKEDDRRVLEKTLAKLWDMPV